MHRIGRTLLIGATFLVASCSDSTGPPALEQSYQLGEIAGEGVTDLDLRPLQHRMRLVDSEGSPLFNRVALSSPSGEASTAQYEMSFWAVRGAAREVEVRSLDEAEQQTFEFMRFSLSPNALLLKPDGSRFKNGDSLQITISIDPARFVMEFQPSGLSFDPDAPAELEIWYGAAEGEVRQDLLGIWYQQEAGTLWYPIVSEHDLLVKRFKTHLFHFSGYAVSW